MKSYNVGTFRDNIVNYRPSLHWDEWNPITVKHQSIFKDVVILALETRKIEIE